MLVFFAIILPLLSLFGYEVINSLNVDDDNAFIFSVTLSHDTFKLTKSSGFKIGVLEVFRRCVHIQQEFINWEIEREELENLSLC